MSPTWLKWIDPDDQKQIAWIGQYLARNGYPDFGRICGYPPNGVALIEAMKGFGQDMGFRYRVDKMRGAWRQKQYRARSGKQIAFQLPNQVRADLARLAKTRGQSRVQTLRQLISDAADQNDRNRQELKKIKEDRKAALQKLEDKHAQMIARYGRVIDNLMEALAEELDKRSRMEAAVGEWGNSSLDDETRPAYHALIEKRVGELEKVQKDLKLMRMGGATLLQRMQALANTHDSEQPAVATQAQEHKA